MALHTGQRQPGAKLQPPGGTLGSGSSPSGAHVDSCAAGSTLIFGDGGAGGDPLCGGAAGLSRRKFPHSESNT